MENIDDSEFSKRTKDSWIKWLQDFRDNMYPVFEHFGISFDTAIKIFRDNILHNDIDNVVEMLYKFKPEEGEDWKNES